MDKETIIELKNIRKEFPGVVALDNVNMKICTSEVHALVGENGAGKSTLMKILSGTYSNYEGQILYHGEEIHMKSEKDAFKYGISIVAQELNYVAELSIAENLFLGREPVKGAVFLNKAARLNETRRLLEYMGLDYDPEEKMGNLNVAQRQMIEILKSLSRDSKVIILDEPTSALTSKESEVLFAKVKELKKKGIAFVFISHRLEEVFELCDQYTVLRDGKWINSGQISDVDTDQLIAMMVGRDIQNIYPKLLPPKEKVLLEIKDLGRTDVFSNISFCVRQGEILGLAGMVGAGRSEIVETLFGMTKADQGEILLDGKKIKRLPGSSMPFFAFDEYYRETPDSIEVRVNADILPDHAGENRYLKYGEGDTFTNRQIAVTYLHGDTWKGIRMDLSQPFASTTVNSENLLIISHLWMPRGLPHCF